MGPLVEIDGLLQQPDPFLGATERDPPTRHSLESHGLGAAVVRGTADLVGLGVVFKSLPGLAATVMNPPEVSQGVGLPGRVAHLAVNGDRFAIELASPVEIAQVESGLPEEGELPPFLPAVTEEPVKLQRLHEQLLGPLQLASAHVDDSHLLEDVGL